MAREREHLVAGLEPVRTAVGDNADCLVNRKPWLKRVVFRGML